MKAPKLQMSDLIIWKVPSLQWNRLILRILFMTSFCLSILANNLSSNIYAKIYDVKDSCTTFAIEAKLLADEIVSSHLIAVQTNGGTVTLSGSVNSLLASERAVKIAKEVKGVRSLINTISLTSLVQSNSQTILDMKKTFSFNMTKDASKIHSSGNEGIMTLFSRMRSWEERQPVAEITKTMEDGRNTQNEITDEKIKSAVRDALFQDPGVISFHVNADVHDGIVILTGVVDDPEAKNAAEEAAKRVMGVLTVVNHLKVRPGILPKYCLTTERVQDVLSKDPVTRPLNINVEVLNNTVYLYGNVNTPYEKQLVQDVILRINEVEIEDVVNNIAVNYQWTSESDEKIKDTVETMLLFGVFVHTYPISVQVKNSVVYLEGTVNDPREARAAVENAFAGGARDVRNFLKVTGEVDEEQIQLRMIEPILFYRQDYPSNIYNYYFHDYYFKEYYIFLTP